MYVPGHSFYDASAVGGRLSSKMEGNGFLLGILLSFVINADANNPLKAIISEVLPGGNDK